MAVGYRNSAGVDFDSLFDPYVSGAKAAATGYLTSTGGDLIDRYAPISVGTKGPDVGFRTFAGLDLSNRWAAIGTASYAGPKLPGFDTSYTVSRGGLHVSTAGCVLTIKTDGTWAVTGDPGGPAGSPLTGTWHTNPAAGVGSTCRVKFHAGDAWQTISVDRAISVHASANDSGTPFDSQTDNLNVYISKTDGTQQVNQTTSITANASAGF